MVHAWRQHYVPQGLLGEAVVGLDGVRDDVDGRLPAALRRDRPALVPTAGAWRGEMRHSFMNCVTYSH